MGAASSVSTRARRFSWLRRARDDAAIRHFEDAVRIKPDGTSAHDKLGTALARQSRGDQAQRHRAITRWLIQSWRGTPRSIDPSMDRYGVGGGGRDLGPWEAGVGFYTLCPTS